MLHAVDYIMDTFPIVNRKDEKKYGEYRTKRLILEYCDAMQRAKEMGKPYKTILDPAPGPPADDHGYFLPIPEWKPGQPKPPNWPSHIHPPKGCETALLAMALPTYPQQESENKRSSKTFHSRQVYNRVLGEWQRLIWEFCLQNAR